MGRCLAVIRESPNFKHTWARELLWRRRPVCYVRWTLDFVYLKYLADKADWSIDLEEMLQVILCCMSTRSYSILVRSLSLSVVRRSEWQLCSRP